MDLSALRETLMADDFDVERHASHVIESGRDISKYAQELAEAEHAIDSMIQEQVSSHYEDLISQATGVQKLEEHLNMMQNHLASLVETADRVRSRVRDPHKVIRTQTVTLARLQDACDLLRRVIRTIQLGKRLQSQLQSGPQEMAKAALSLNELSELWVPEMNSIELIEQDQRMILHAKTDVERNADGMMTRGMENQNQNHITIAIQVFQNLGLLEDKLNVVLEANKKAVATKLADNFDVRKITEESGKSRNPGGGSSGVTGGPGKANIVTGGNMATFRAVLWNNIESSLDFIFNKMCEVICLQNVLAKKQDAVTHSPFKDLLPEMGNRVMKMAWLGVIDALSETLSKATKESNFMKQALEGEYPKVLRLLNDLWRRLTAAAVDLKTLEDDELENPFKLTFLDPVLRQTLSGLEKAYLSKSLSRLFDPINLMFSAEDIPSDTELSQVFKGISSEINVSLVDEQLKMTVSKNVAKTIKLMCVKCEQIVVTDGEASQVVGYPTEGQKKNVAIVNCLSKFRAGVEDIIAGFVAKNQISKEVTDVINEALLEVDKQVRNAISPLLSSIQDAIEAILLTIHKEDFSAEEMTEKEAENAKNACSLYMKELQGFLSRVAVEFLSDFLCQELIAESVLPLAVKCIENFILHASLVRPLGKAGEKRLAADCSHLELALEPVVGHQPAALNDSYAQLRSFKSLLFLEPSDYKSVDCLGKTLRPSTALHLLFSKAPAELKSPHESAGWSLSRYSQWLEAHPLEQERLQLIQGTLESYVAGTRARKETTYAFPYPIMLEILQSALKM